MESATNNTSTISLFDAIIIELNAMVGAGIFSIPLLLRAQAGPAGILTYIGVTAAVWCLAVSLGRVAKYYAGSGSFYTYVKPWAGHYGGLFTAFLYLLGLVVAMGLLTQLTGLYLHDLVHQLPAVGWSLLTLAALVYLCHGGYTAAAWVQYLLIFGTIAPLIFMSMLCFSIASWQNLTPFMPHGILPVITATRAVIFGFLGFECVTSLYTMLKSPQKNLSRSIASAVIITGLLYCTFVASIMLAIPAHLAVSGTTTLPELMLVLFPNYAWLITLITITIIIALVGTLHSMILSISNLLKDTVSIALPHRRISLAAAVYLICGMIGLSCIAFHNIDLFLSMTSLCVVTAYACSIATLFLPSTKSTRKDRIIAACGLVTAGIITISAGMGIYTILFTT